MTKYIFAAIGIEGITEILLHSTLLEKPRKLLCRVKFFDDLFSCGWCMSLWVALFVLGLFLLNLEVVLIPIVFQRISNFIHVFYVYIRSLRRE